MQQMAPKPRAELRQKTARSGEARSDTNESERRQQRPEGGEVFMALKAEERDRI